MDELWMVVVSALVGALSALATAFLRGRTDADTAIRARRVEAYELFMDETAAVPAWPPKEDLTYGELSQLQEALRSWYFADGGLIMSAATRDAYGRLQKGLERRRLAVGPELLDGRLVDHRLAADGRLEAKAFVPHVRGDPEAKGRDDYDEVQQLLSLVRTEMTRDLLSRTRPLALRGPR